MSCSWNWAGWSGRLWLCNPGDGITYVSLQQGCLGCLGVVGLFSWKAPAF